MAALFTALFFIGTASLALWIDTRAPGLAPNGILWRAACVVVTLFSFSFVPIVTDSYATLYASVFGLLLPLLTAMWLSALWLFRSAADALASRY
jgi:hypothetical protein